MYFIMMVNVDLIDVKFFLEQDEVTVLSGLGFKGNDFEILLIIKM